MKLPNILRVLIFIEDKHWVAQCLEYDIVAQGETVKELKSCFEESISLLIASEIEAGQQPLQNVVAAPNHFFKDFKDAAFPFMYSSRLVVPTKPPHTFEIKYAVM